MGMEIRGTGREIFPTAFFSHHKSFAYSLILQHNLRQKWIGIGLVPQIGSCNLLAQSYIFMLLVFDSKGMIGLCYAWL